MYIRVYTTTIDLLYNHQNDLSKTAWVTEVLPDCLKASVIPYSKNNK